MFAFIVQGHVCRHKSSGRCVQSHLSKGVCLYCVLIITIKCNGFELESRFLINVSLLSLCSCAVYRKYFAFYRCLIKNVYDFRLFNYPKWHFVIHHPASSSTYYQTMWIDLSRCQYSFKKLFCLSNEYKILSNSSQFQFTNCQFSVDITIDGRHCNLFSMERSGSSWNGWSNDHSNCGSTSK